MSRTFTVRTVVAGCICIALAGCGSSAASPPAKKTVAPAFTPTPKPTAVGPEMAAYAQLTEPVLRSGIAQAGSLINLMQSRPTSSLGRPCADGGANIAQNYDAFKAIPRPTTVDPTWLLAKKGYTGAMSASDECGIAADSNKGDVMYTAAKDLRNSIGELTQAENTMSSWRTKH